jgi:hypothetical protein
MLYNICITITKDIKVHSWLGYKKKKKKTLGLLWGYFLQIIFTWNKSNWFFFISPI